MITKHRGQKWNKSQRDVRLKYIRLVLEDHRFKDKLFYTSRPQANKPDYDLETVEGIAAVFTSKFGDGEYSAEIYVDGISKAKREDYQTELRRQHVRVHKVHSARDESSSLTRLADALAGLAREAIEGDAKVTEIVRQAKKLGSLIEVE